MQERETRPTRILVLATHPKEIASTRFRLLQYLEPLRKAGYEIVVRTFFSSDVLDVVYSRRSVVERSRVLLKSALGRLQVLKEEARDCDCVLVHRELFPLNLPFGLDLLEKLDMPMIYDFDDAMFLPQRAGRRVASWLEHTTTTARLIERSTQVIAGNEFLGEYARSLNANVTVIPTVVDTDLFRPPMMRWEGPPSLGWIGSHTTFKYLESILPLLKRMSARHLVRLRIAGAPRRPDVTGMPITVLPWRLDREISDFQSIDIGLYPLFDDDWSRGKCGFKAIQYFAVGIPVVAAAVGVNEKLIDDGVNGYLIHQEDEWVRRLHTLIEDVDLRAEMGRAGREKVVREFSVRAQAPRLIDLLDRVTGRSSVKPREGGLLKTCDGS